MIPHYYLILVFPIYIVLNILIEIKFPNFLLYDIERFRQQHDLIFMPFLLEGVALEMQYLQRDYKHPNALGIKIIANNLYPYLVQGVAARQANN